MSSRKDEYNVEELESLLLTEESRIEKNVRNFDASSNVVNLATHTNNQSKRFQQNNDNSFGSHGNSFGLNVGHSTKSSTFHSSKYYNNGGRGRGSYHNGVGKPQCQLCSKFGHLVFKCWHRFNQNFQGPLGSIVVLKLQLTWHRQEPM